PRRRGHGRGLHPGRPPGPPTAEAGAARQGTVAVARDLGLGDDTPIKSGLLDGGSVFVGSVPWHARTPFAARDVAPEGDLRLSRVWTADDLLAAWP
uniref:hypothetical protein n=1 Tax=uncultured Cellulosimicrobium sp. TaxID=307826 RepID=UPI0025967D0D